MLAFYLALIDDKADYTTFEHIFQKYKNEMIRVAYDIVKNQWDAEDATQNALIGLAVSIKLVPSSAKEMRAYCLAAARNAALRYQKKKSVWDHIVNIDTVRFPNEDSVFEKIVAEEEYQSVLALLVQLPLALREAMMLRYVTDIPPREIARILNRKPDTVRKQLLRGKQLLATYFLERKKQHE